jgi:hypothetical protein
MRRRWLALLIAAPGFSLPLAAQEEAPGDADAPPEAAAPAAETPASEAPASEAPPADEAAEEREPGGASDARRAAAERESIFAPSSEVEPDEESIFPVNF